MKSNYISVTDLFFLLECVINIEHKECLTHSLILGKLVSLGFQIRPKPSQGPPSSLVYSDSPKLIKKHHKHTEN